MTVSNLVNGRYELMSEETRRRVEHAIERLNYRPHTAARGLRRAERLSIGMVVIDTSPTYLADPFITRVVAGLSNHLSENGYALVLQGLPPDRLREAPVIRDIRTDGICAMLSGGESVRRRCLDALLGLHQPLVLFQEMARTRGKDICIVRQDDRAGGRALAHEALRAGARRLVMLVPRLYWPAIAERERGVRDAIREAKAGARLRLVKCAGEDLAEIQTVLQRDMTKNGRPDAVLAGNDQIGIAAMKLMAAQGVRVPEEILITGFNAFDFWQFSDPVLTTVRSPAYALGACGGAEILRRLKAGAFSGREIVLPVELQRGGSTNSDKECRTDAI